PPCLEVSGVPMEQVSVNIAHRHSIRNPVHTLHVFLQRQQVGHVRICDHHRMVPQLHEHRALVGNSNCPSAMTQLMRREEHVSHDTTLADRAGAPSTPATWSWECRLDGGPVRGAGPQVTAVGPSSSPEHCYQVVMLHRPCFAVTSVVPARPCTSPAAATASGR